MTEVLNGMNTLCWVEVSRRFNSKFSVIGGTFLKMKRLKVLSQGFHY